MQVVPVRQNQRCALLLLALTATAPSAAQAQRADTTSAARQPIAAAATTARRRISVAEMKRRLLGRGNARTQLARTSSHATVSAIVPRLAILLPTQSTSLQVRLDGPRFWSPNDEHIGFLIKGSEGELLAIFPERDTERVFDTLDAGQIKDIRVLKGDRAVQCLGSDFNYGLVIVTLSVAGTKTWNAGSHPAVAADRIHCAQAF
jgi:hypothetical protein